MLAEYQKAPQVTRDRMYIDTMQQIYSNVTKVMVDASSGSNLLYLPLDKLMQQAGGRRAADRRRRRRRRRRARRAAARPPARSTSARATASAAATAKAAERTEATP